MKQTVAVTHLDQPSQSLPFRFGWNSIHRKLLTTYVALTVLGTSLLAGYILWSFQVYFMRNRQAELDSWSTALSESVGDALEENDLESAELLVKRYGASESITLRIFEADGRLLATSAPELDRQVQNWLEVPGIEPALGGETTQGIAKGVLTNDDRLYVVRPIIRNGKMLGALRMSITLAQFQRQFRTVTGTVLGTLVLTILLCALISEWFARSIATPIQAMRNFAIRLGGGHFGDKLNIRETNELGQLATELNRMSERLASLDQERRAFLANVSHELRTPVSNVQVTLEALENGAYDDPEFRDRFLQTAQDETKRLSRLVHDLLDLGRLEAGVTPLEEQTLSLIHLVDRSVRAIESRTRSKRVQIAVDIPDVKIYGDPERLLQAFLNVLDNAMKHSIADSTVFVYGQIDGNRVAIHVRDQGIGISETDLPHIFEQFYTADPSRKGSSTGLGLTIARRIVEAHGGSISANSQYGKGATFTIRLPLSSKA